MYMHVYVCMVKRTSRLGTLFNMNLQIQFQIRYCLHVPQTTSQNSLAKFARGGRGGTLLPVSVTP